MILPPTMQRGRGGQNHPTRLVSSYRIRYTLRALIDNGVSKWRRVSRYGYRSASQDDRNGSVRKRVYFHPGNGRTLNWWNS